MEESIESIDEPTMEELIEQPIYNPTMEELIEQPIYNPTMEKPAVPIRACGKKLLYFFFKNKFN
jgi:hypothetical protein